MKKCLVYLRRFGVLAETTPGWQTDTPGLALCKWTAPNAPKNTERWALVHQPSGRVVRTFEKREQGQRFAERLGEADFARFREVGIEQRRAYTRALEAEAKETT